MQVHKLRRRFVVTLALAAVVTVRPWQSVFGQVPRLCPEPQQLMIERGRAPFDLSKGYVLRVISPEASPVAEATGRLRGHIERVHGPLPQRQDEAEIAIGITEDWGKAGAADALPREMLEAARLLPNEGYVLHVRHEHVWIAGKDARGAAYGVETFIQLLRGREPIPALRIRDYPDTSFRLCYIGGGDRLTRGIKQQIDRAFHYKLDMLVLENGGFYHLDDPKVLTGVREVFDYCRRIGIEPIPELQSFGWAHFILPIDPTCVEATPYKNRLFKFGPDDIAVHQVEKTHREIKIENPGLAEGGGHRFEGWEQDDVGKTVFADEREPGNRCLRITRAASGMSRIWQTVACEPHADYSLEVDMRTEAGKGFAAYFEVYGDKGLFKSYAWIKQTTDWQRRRIMFHTGESTELTIYLRIQEGAGQAWFDNVTCEPGTAFPMINVVRAPGLPIEVKSEDGEATFREGADYEIVPGDFGYPFKGEAKPWQIRRTPASRIQPGQLVRVSYHWAKPGAITYCPSEPRTHQIMKGAIQQTIRLLRPRFVHIGHDEPRVINVDARCRQRNLKAHELFAEDVKRLYDYAKEADSAVRPMMWADALRVRDGKVQIAWHSKEICTLEEAVRGIPKDVIMCRWTYGSDKRPVNAQVTNLCDFTTPLLAAGYDVTVSPWYDLVNAYCWGRATKCMREAEGRTPSQTGKCLGLFATTWHNRWEALPLCADLMWTLSSPHFAQVSDPEQLRRTLKEALTSVPVRYR